LPSKVYCVSPLSPCIFMMLMLIGPLRPRSFAPGVG
jgi:hypothetical protein